MVKGSNHIFFDVNNANITVNAGSGGTDTVAPTAPVLAASGTTSTSTNLSWSGATDNVAVTGYDVYQGASLIGSTASTSYTVTSLTPSTTYSFSVKAKDAAGNVSPSSNTVSVTTLAGSTVTYCSASATNTGDERIGNVKFGTINNTSTGTAGYEDFTSVSTNVTRGSAYTISVTPVWTSTVYSEAYAVYIDYNKDGDFTDSGELAWSKAGSTTTPATGSITIPAAASLGTTRMRVMMKYSSVPTSSCGSYTYGQVEDYTLNIVSSGRGEILDTKDLLTDIKLYPNPAKDILNISNTTSEDYKIFDMGGKLINSGKLVRGSVNVSGLIKGAYMIQIGEITKRFIKN
ncbi:GEVED domain-containing protein [Chryseobacterium wanjuense]